MNFLIQSKLLQRPVKKHAGVERWSQLQHQMFPALRDTMMISGIVTWFTALYFFHFACDIRVCIKCGHLSFFLSFILLFFFEGCMSTILLILIYVSLTLVSIVDYFVVNYTVSEFCVCQGNCWELCRHCFCK